MLALSSRNMLNDLLDRIKLPFRKEKELYSSLYSIIGRYPKNIDYYKLALMHKSVARRNAKGRPLNNERLEFLGDAILDAIVGSTKLRERWALTNSYCQVVRLIRTTAIWGETLLRPS